MPKHQLAPVENRRRLLMALDRELYDYVETNALQRELERIGGDVGGAADGYGAANRLWHIAGQWRERRDRIIAGSVSGALTANQRVAEGDI